MTLVVPLADPAADHRNLASELEPKVLEVLRSGRYILGPEHEALESEARERLGSAACLLVSSGTDALLLSLMSCGIGPGDEVVTTPFTFFATGGAIHRVGAKPVFADIDPTTYGLSRATVEPALTERTRAVLVVHLYGGAADVAGLTALCEERGLFLLEDAAQALGSTNDGRPLGTFGRFGALSFFPSKNLGAAGDAGMLLVRDEIDCERTRCLRTHGETSRYHHRYVGGNFRLDELQAAYLRVKWRHLAAWTARRRENAAYYRERLSVAGLSEVLSVPTDAVHAGHNYHQFTLQHDDRESVRSALQAQGIATGVYYPVPLHRQPCFEFLGQSRGALPVVERVADRVFSIPVGHHVTDEMRAHVADCLIESVAR